MEIIKHGIPQKQEDSKFLMFCCTKCGCIFKCNLDNYVSDWEGWSNYVAKCPEPFCGEICHTYKS